MAFDVPQLSFFYILYADYLIILRSMLFLYATEVNS